ncbi:hypothetical protein W02_31840 [Nitrospira sp. KM1]|uniref:YgaP family membrane protein n=1 Tax=Nitrospira sp. KM1 TaxID=1936990 RepID=UPI0013A78C45|nr:DUF2892 domain-containing protein [Nitrospira sp. KM1]BCA56044.1 hypothetical protein W02_31840 [Nitrospira sp. KM1]
MAYLSEDIAMLKGYRPNRRQLTRLRDEVAAGSGQNVGDTERIASAMLASGMFMASIARLTRPTGKIAVLIGAALAYRALTGDCPLYRTLGLTSKKGGVESYLT